MTGGVVALCVLSGVAGFLLGVVCSIMFFVRAILETNKMLEAKRAKRGEGLSALRIMGERLGSDRIDA